MYWAASLDVIWRHLAFLAESDNGQGFLFKDVRGKSKVSASINKAAGGPEKHMNGVLMDSEERTQIYLQ